MITTKIKGKKKILSSSYFDDVRLLRKSRFDTDYLDLKRNSNFDTVALQRAYVIQGIILWKQGCQELSEYVARLPNNQLEGVTTLYMGEDYVADSDTTEVQTSNQKEIASPDDNI